MKTVILLIFMIISARAASNCSSSWTEYKTVREVSLRYSSENENEFKVNRTTRFRCSNDSIIQFKTHWTTREEFDENVQNFEIIGTDIQTSCLGENCENIMLQVSVDFQTRLWRFCCLCILPAWTEWSSSISGNYFFAVKNCDKLYWTNWIETTSCSTSTVIIRRRTCMDCDGDALEQKYCDATGHAVDENDCNHYWGNWTEWPCVTTGCNTVGERVRTRQCLYDEGREVTDVRLCSNGNESAIMKKKCTNRTIPAECLSQTSSVTNNAEINKGFYFGIGVAVALIVILCILLVIMRYRRLKSTQFLPTNTANPNQSSYELANATVKVSEQSDNVSRAFDFSQQNPAVAHRFANSTTTTATINDRSFRDLKSTKQNKLEDDSVEEPVAYDYAQTNRSNAKTFDQAPDRDMYVTKTRDVSNAYAIATRADPNLYEIEDLSQDAASNLPTALSVEDKPKQNNTYSSLQSSSGVVESTYSKLER